MRFSVFDIGKLVRPQMLSRALIFNNTEPQNFDRWWKNYRIGMQYGNYAKLKNSLRNIYRTELSNIFKTLSIGDLSKEEQLAISYVGKITGFVVLLCGTYVYVEKPEEVEALIKRAARHKVKPTDLHIVAASLAFYKGVKREEDGSLTPIDPWHLTAEPYNGMRFVWLYERSRLIDLAAVEKYEKLNPGDPLFFEKTQGLVVENTVLNKPGFYKTSSWTSHCVKYFNDKRRILDRLNPLRDFKLLKDLAG